MEFRKILALRGPNIWAHFPVLEAWVDLGALKDASSDELPGFNDRLTAWLPGMIEHRCSVGERGGFFQRLRRGTDIKVGYQTVDQKPIDLTLKIDGFGRSFDQIK